MLGHIWKIDAGRSVPTILEASGIPLSSIGAIILGHAHLDHGGDLRRFPASVPVIVGPDSPVPAELADELDVPLSTLEEREVRYLTRDEAGWMDVGCFKGYDLWHDGSLFIMDAPGVSSFLLLSKAHIPDIHDSIRLVTSPPSSAHRPILPFTTSSAATPHTTLTSSGRIHLPSPSPSPNPSSPLPPPPSFPLNPNR